MPREAAVRRAALLLAAAALLAVPLVSATSAAWVDTADVTGTTVTGGTVDLTLDGAQTLASSTLSMPTMVPGSRSAQVVRVGNHGTAPLRWSMTGGLSGPDAAAYGSSAALSVTVVRGGTRTAVTSGAACTGGTRGDGTVSLATAQRQVAALATTVAPGDGVSVCLEVALASDAPTTLQGRSASLSLVATGTTDLGS